MAISERKIIASICKGIKNPQEVLIGASKDDAACIRAGTKILAITSDIMFANSHFPKKMPLASIGRKAVVANISDLASMGAKPKYLVLSLGIPRGFTGLSRVILGIKKTCAKYGAIIIGGDTKRSRELTISICAIGEIEGRTLTRNNAKSGDVVAVTGNIGSAYLGLHSLLYNKSASRLLVNAFNNPKARVEEGLILSRFSSRASAMDITDGLLYTASEIARESKVGIKIDPKLITISRLAKIYAKKNKISFTHLINTGEDYELLVCLSENDFKKLNKRAGLIRIGKVIKSKGVYLDNNPISERGYDAFRRNRRT
ncbi:MAG: thiamine-phosphate kinase [Candidatus Micrarchaeota archaeon]